MFNYLNSILKRKKYTIIDEDYCDENNISIHENSFEDLERGISLTKRKRTSSTEKTRKKVRKVKRKLKLYRIPPLGKYNYCSDSSDSIKESTDTFTDTSDKNKLGNNLSMFLFMGTVVIFIVYKYCRNN